MSIITFGILAYTSFLMAALLTSDENQQEISRLDYEIRKLRQELIHKQNS